MPVEISSDEEEEESVVETPVAKQVKVNMKGKGKAVVQPVASGSRRIDEDEEMGAARQELAELCAERALLDVDIIQAMARIHKLASR